MTGYKGWSAWHLLACSAAALIAMASSAPAQDEIGVSTIRSDVPEPMRAALDRITAASMQGDLWFIAHDLLGGRDTPSPGLDLAAHYIAAQFRGAGLEPVGDDGYFQTAMWESRERGRAEFDATIRAGAQSIDLRYEEVSIAATDDEVSTAGAPLVRLACANVAALDGMDAAPLEGAVVLTDLPNPRTAPRESQREAFLTLQDVLPRLERAGVAAVIAVDRRATEGSGFGSGDLVDPQGQSPRRRGMRFDPPLLWSHNPQVAALFDALADGPADGSVDLTLGPAHAVPVPLRNVVGALRGRDPVRRDQWVLVTAHYDHIGASAPVDGDGIFNGANDDGSGTVTLVAIARALASLSQEDRPGRSILFVAVFGEERGLLGSQHYVRNPIVPLAQTIGNVNLEQVGRTDSTDGPQVNRASLTGFAFSTLTDSFVQAGQALGVEVYDHPANSEPFFSRSDNVAFAAAGIPAHTLCVAYVYPDYHGRGDHWDKVDYDNMARIGRMTALGVWFLSDRTEPPAWNEDHPRTGRFVEAWRRLHASPQP